MKCKKKCVKSGNFWDEINRFLVIRSSASCFVC